jgi:hypothetical protein
VRCPSDFTNPESPEFSATFETYALPGTWATPDVFSADLMLWRRHSMY